tara:strand:+ start:2196 stop:2894 length:699 start_codon:yes stop_codon:yes gene_type:complete
MKPLALVIVFFVIVWGNAQIQNPPLPEDYFVIEGDTIINLSIELKEVVLFQPLRFYNYDDAKRYVILRDRTYRVYPYAKMAADRLNILTGRLKQIKSNRKRRKYLKRLENFIYDEFEKELKKLSRSQGRILIKLVHRQIGETTHQLVKDLRNGWRAFIYQTTASLFKLSLKETYDPKTVYEDYLIEDILQRAFSEDRLERQDTALDYDLDSLYQYWKKNKPKFIHKKKSLRQ